MLERGNEPTEFLSTHPSHGTRITEMVGWMPEALALYHPATDEPSPDLPALRADPRVPDTLYGEAPETESTVLPGAAPALTRRRPLHSM